MTAYDVRLKMQKKQKQNEESQRLAAVAARMESERLRQELRNMSGLRAQQEKVQLEIEARTSLGYRRLLKRVKEAEQRNVDLLEAFKRIDAIMRIGRTRKSLRVVDQRTAFDLGQAWPTAEKTLLTVLAPTVV